MCNHTYSNCGCSPTPCATTNCACDVYLSSDCVNNVKANMPCSDIPKGLSLTEVLEQLDAFICAKFDTVTNYFTLINIGGGAEIYKDVNNLGQKELRTISTSETVNPLITVVQNSNTVDINPNRTNLQVFIENLIPTYTAQNLGAGIAVYKEKVGTEFKFKSLTSTNSSATITETETTVDLAIPVTSIEAGTNTTVTGAGVTGNPFIINSTFHLVAGSNITLTGTGTSLDPINISTTEPAWLRGDTKEVVCDNTYLANNFEESGLGKSERLGWAIVNGNNGTPNDDGLVVIAYGNTYSTLEATGGSADAILPEHFHYMFSNEVNTGGAGIGLVTEDKNVARGASGKDALGYEMGYAGVTDIDSATLGRTSTTGESGIGKNLQPYVVRLRIMKL